MADALAFDDIINHPDNQTFAEQIKNEHRGQISEVDQKAKTRPSNTPDSEEGSWTAEALFDGPDGAGDKVPAMAGADRPGDTMETSAARNTPTPLEQLRLTDIGEPGGNRSLRNEVDEGHGGGNVDLRDRNPAARNHDGDDPNPNWDGSSRNDATEVRSDGTPANSDATSSSRKPVAPAAPTSAAANTGDPSLHDDQGPNDRDDSDIGQDDEGSDPSNNESEIDQQSPHDMEGTIEDSALEPEGSFASDLPFAERYGLDTNNGEFSEASKPLPTLDRSE
ncbi:hypothetical protein ACWGKS_29615, partial [Nocardiopsis sp. NPDC055879]